MAEIREKTLRDQHQYRRILPDTFYENATDEMLESEFKRIHEKYDMNLSKSDQAAVLKKLHRKRHLTCWHDGSGIANHGHLLITFSTTYDEALFYTDQEYFELYSKTFSVFLLCFFTSYFHRKRSKKEKNNRSDGPIILL